MRRSEDFGRLARMQSDNTSSKSPKAKLIESKRGSHVNFFRRTISPNNPHLKFFPE
jgi:hypothetical protein